MAQAKTRAKTAAERMRAYRDRLRRRVQALAAAPNFAQDLAAFAGAEEGAPAIIAGGALVRRWFSNLDRGQRRLLAIALAPDDWAERPAHAPAARVRALQEENAGLRAALAAAASKPASGVALSLVEEKLAKDARRAKIDRAEERARRVARRLGMER